MLGVVVLLIDPIQPSIFSSIEYNGPVHYKKITLIFRKTNRGSNETFLAFVHILGVLGNQIKQFSFRGTTIYCAIFQLANPGALQRIELRPAHAGVEVVDSFLGCYRKV